MTMDVIADTGFVYAIFQPHDRRHRTATDYYLDTLDNILFPIPALTELAFLSYRAGGNPAVLMAMRALRQSRLSLIPFTDPDHDRVITILTKYTDTRIDFVDACIMALAERLNVTRILTFDRRDFSIYKPVHRKHFDLLP